MPWSGEPPSSFPIRRLSSGPAAPDNIHHGARTDEMLKEPVASSSGPTGKTMNEGGSIFPDMKSEDHGK